MENIEEILRGEFLRLKNKPHVDQKILEKFLERLDGKKGLFRFENPRDHYCVYFLPLDLKSRSIFIGHHIKANSWIPPGGHIEESESPLETIKREFFEELAYQVTDEQVEFFDLTITDINNPKQVCKRHWDMWYLVHVTKTNFKLDKREFYDAGWYQVEKALPLVKIENYKTTIKKIFHSGNGLL